LTTPTPPEEDDSGVVKSAKGLGEANKRAENAILLRNYTIGARHSPAHTLMVCPGLVTPGGGLTQK